MKKLGINKKDAKVLAVSVKREGGMKCIAVYNPLLQKNIVVSVLKSSNCKDSYRVWRSTGHSEYVSYNQLWFAIYRIANLEYPIP